MWEVVWKWGWPLYQFCIIYSFLESVCICVCVCARAEACRLKYPEFYSHLPRNASWGSTSFHMEGGVGKKKKKKRKCIKIYCAAFSFSLFQMFPSTRRKPSQLKKDWLWTAMHGSGMTGRKEGIRDCEEERRNSVDGVRICIHSGGLQSSAVCTGSLSRSWKCRIFTLCLSSIWPRPLHTHTVNPHLYIHIYANATTAMNAPVWWPIISTANV